MKRAGSFGFVAATVILVLIAAFSFAGTVMSRTSCSDAELEGYYKQLEEGLAEDTRAYLEEQGLYNSGVMVNRVVEADGSREYAVTVHHREIDRMSEEERTALSEELAGLTFADENCTFCHYFLLDESDAK